MEFILEGLMINHRNLNVTGILLLNRWFYVSCTKTVIKLLDQVVADEQILRRADSSTSISVCPGLIYMRKDISSTFY